MRPADYLILIIILLALAAYKIRAFVSRRGINSRGAPAARAVDREVKHLLTKRGYEVIAVKERAGYQVADNGRLHNTFLVADLIVKKDGRRFAALIEKEGEDASSFTRAGGRVRLLPWQAIFGAQGILIIDPASEKIHTVSFKLKTYGERDRYLLLFLAGAVTGAAAAVILLIFKGG